MPYPDEGMVDPNDEGATAFADDPGAVDPTEAEGGGDGASPNDDPYFGKSREDVIAMYKAAQTDGNRLSELQGKVDALLALRQQPQQRDEDTQQSALDQRLSQLQASFNEDWTAKIEAEPGKNTVAFMQGALAELAAAFREEIQAAKGGFGQSLFENSPEYRANREKVDGLASSLNIPKQEAFQALKQAKIIVGTTRQPGTPKAPGRTSDAVSGKTEEGGAAPKLAGFARTSPESALRMAGLSDKDIAAEIAAIEAEMSKGGGAR